MLNHAEDKNIELEKKIIYDSDTSQIVHLVCQCFIYILGFFLHYKIVHVYNLERSPTWLNQISHAVIGSVHWGVRVPFTAVTHFVPNLSNVTGSWICYIGAFVSFYGFQELTARSLWIAIEKYVLMVHTLKARVFGEEKIGKIMLIVHICYPLLASIIAMITTNYDTRAEVKSCFGVVDDSIPSSNMTSSGKSSFLFCDVSYYSEISLSLSYFIQFLCVSRTFLNGLICTNIPEAFIYYKLFKFMKR